MLTSFSVGRESGAPLFTNLSEGSLSEVSHRGLFTYKAATQSNKLRNINKLLGVKVYVYWYSLYIEERYIHSQLPTST